VSDAWLRFSTPSSPTASKSLMKCPQCRTRMERVRSSARMHQVLSAIIAHAAVGRGSAVPQPLLFADRRAPNAVGRKTRAPWLNASGAQLLKLMIARSAATSLPGVHPGRSVPLGA
jgi:hypothetical protein